MGTQPLDYAAIIADLEAKKAAIEATIATLRSAMALGTLGAGQGGDVPVAGGQSGAIYGNEVPAGAFLGKSIPEAARLYLEIVKKKQTSREIAEALQDGGMESTSGNFVGIVHAVLDRARKSPNASIVKLGTQWGLAGWYPKGILNSVAAAAAPKKKGKKAKAAKKADATSKADAKPAKEKPAENAPAPMQASAQPNAQESRDASGTSAQLLALLKQSPAQDFSADVLAEKVGKQVQVTRMVLGKLIKDGIVHKTATGTYQAVSAA